MISALMEKDKSKYSYSRILGTIIIMTWVIPALIVGCQGKPLPAFPPVAAALALLLYFSNMMGAQLIQAVVKRFLGVKADVPAA